MMPSVSVMLIRRGDTLSRFLPFTDTDFAAVVEGSFPEVTWWDLKLVNGSRTTRS
jgi:hypothetical protein